MRKIRTKDWYNHAEKCLTSIKSFTLHSPLGYYSSPEEYIETVEDFLKIFYGINEVPKEPINVFNKAKQGFDTFKNDISALCEILLERAKQINDDES